MIIFLLIIIVLLMLGPDNVAGLLFLALYGAFFLAVGAVGLGLLFYVLS